MKKYLGILVIVTTLFMFTGCGNKTTNTEEAREQETTTLSDCRKGCDIVTNATMKKDDCYALCETSKKLESDDISDCDNIETTSNKFITKDICIQDKAIQERNPKYCGNISEARMKDACYIGLAKDMKDKKICDSIIDETIKSICTTDQE